MRAALLIILGWLFGLLSPPIVLKIEKRYKRKSLKIVVVNELNNLSFRLAGSYYIIQTHLGNKDKASIAWVRGVFEKHKGDCPEALLKLMDTLLELPDGQFEALQDEIKEKENVGLGLKTFSLPFTESILENIEIFDSKFQKDILKVRDEIIILNEEIELAMYYFRLTFDTAAMNTNAKIIKINIKRGYEIIQDRCKLIIDKIDRIMDYNQ